MQNKLQGYGGGGWTQDPGERGFHDIALEDGIAAAEHLDDVAARLGHGHNIFA